MVTLNLYGGPLKRAIVQEAYGDCGQSVAEYELTPEDYDIALRRMDAMLQEWETRYGIALGYNYPAYGNGSPEDESGITDYAAIQAVVGGLAMRIAPTIGKSPSPESKAAAAESFAALRSAYLPQYQRQLTRQTPRGAGNRYGRWWGGPFFRPSYPDPVYPPGDVVSDIIDG